MLGNARPGASGGEERRGSEGRELGRGRKERREGPRGTEHVVVTGTAFFSLLRSVRRGILFRLYTYIKYI
jgi:hypothetical protein